jgi:hypothetical protein
VLNYRRLQALWPLVPSDIEQYTQALQDFAELVNPQTGGRLVPNDEEDDPVLETALRGRVMPTQLPAQMVVDLLVDTLATSMRTHS